jgi:hypothetical protein
MSMAFSRTSETLIFAKSSLHDEDDTVTKILPQRRKPAPGRSRARKPPKPRTTNEAALPSIMVTQDSWAPQPPSAPAPSSSPLPREYAPERMLPTRIVAPFRPEQRWSPSLVFACFAIVLAIAGFLSVPLIGAIMNQ